MPRSIDRPPSTSAPAVESDARDPAAGAPPEPVLPAEHERLAGHRDAVLRERTGRDWQAWVVLLDEAGAAGLSHAELAQLVATHLDDAWWCQAVAVGYERLRGLRKAGQARDGSFSASKSKTLPAGAPVVFALLQQQVEHWDGLVLSGATPHRSVRLAGADGSTPRLWIAEKGPDKCSVSVDHKGLPSAAAADAAKHRWGVRLGELARLLRA